MSVSSLKLVQCICGHVDIKELYVNLPFEEVLNLTNNVLRLIMCFSVVFLLRVLDNMFLGRRNTGTKREKIFKRTTSAIYVSVGGDSCLFSFY